MVSRGPPFPAVEHRPHGEPVPSRPPFPRRSCGGRNLAAPCPRHSRESGNPVGVLPLNKVCNRRRNLSILLPGLRVNRVLYLSILSTLRRPAQGHGLLPATIEQGAHRFEKLGGGPIDHIYGWAPSYKRGLWVVQVRRSCNQRTHSRRDRDRGGCQWIRHSRAGGNPEPVAMESFGTICDSLFMPTDVVLSGDKRPTPMICFYPCRRGDPGSAIPRGLRKNWSSHSTSTSGRVLLDDTDPAVVELSHVLNSLEIQSERPDADRFRNPNGVALKLANFAARDPNYDGRGYDARQ